MATAGAGGLSARTWTHLRTVLPYSLAAATVALLLARQIDVLALGDEPAMGLGLRVEWLRAGLIAIVAVLTGSAVAVAGLIGFVGGDSAAHRAAADRTAAWLSSCRRAGF